MVRIKSPGCNPALSAGLSGITSRTHPYIFGIGLVPRGTFILSVGAGGGDDGGLCPFLAPPPPFFLFKTLGKQPPHPAGASKQPPPPSPPPPTRPVTTN